MCGLCGVLGAEDHWTDAASRAELRADGTPGRTRRQERLHRVAVANRILAGYGLSLRDWQGSSYVLSGRTGRTRIVPHLAALWQAAEELAGRPCDPLDPATVAAVEAQGPAARPRGGAG